ncbi:MAG: HTH domain-containing protein [Deltaproteobacteria bacterium]|nr:HTH domain-containing protein [Deltaproteobacteria bacterium]
MKRTERLFAIAEALRGRRTGVTAEELADRFGVSLRTMYRDLDALREAELPLAAERGRGGGYALDRTYSLPPVNFDVREAAVLLVLGKLASELRLVPFTQTLSSALDKVRAALPTAAQRRVESLGKHLTFVGVPAHKSHEHVRRAVETAWFEARPLRITYLGSDDVLSVRNVRLESVTLERTTTFLQCRDLERDEPRQFRLHRIERAELLDPEP